ncbi:phage/plasmid primase, P4 family [Paenibacillus sp. FSL P4-0113]|uniref:DNA primase family protein n=1 Tax=Paenibacillus sp. FSL P4-0113 TaxID=2921630 RepID=UPI0030F7F63D
MDHRTLKASTVLAEAPSWIFQRPTRVPSNKSTFASAQTNVQGSLKTLHDRCPRFAQDYATQQQQGLDEETWFKWVQLLPEELALEFSALSDKHDTHSQNRIRQLQQNKKPPTRCRTLGCNEQQIATCFHHRVRKNEEGIIVNSPAKMLSQPKTKKSTRANPYMSKTTKLKSVHNIGPKDVGFTLDNNNKPTRLNPNLFSEFIRRHYLKTIFVAPEQRYYVYKSGVWQDQLPDVLKRNARKILHTWAPHFWRSKIEAEYMTALTRDCTLEHSMDSERDYINLRNGMLDLRNFKLEEHDPTFYSSVQVPIDYEPEAPCPNFEAFLKDIFDHDQERIDLIAEIFGYCLTTSTQAEQVFLFYGKGSNGKSVLVHVLKGLIGERNTSALSLNDLEKPFARSEMINKLVNITTENEVGSKGIETSYLKAIASGDPVRIEEKFKQGYMQELFCKLIFATNNLPYSKDKSYGLIRKMTMVPFEKTYTDAQKDPDLKVKLMKEGSGILNFALEGLKRLRKHSYLFTKSKKVQQLANQYSQMINPIQVFVEDMVEAKPESKLLNKDLKAGFVNWCHREGHNGLSNISNQQLTGKVKEVLKEQGIVFEPDKSGGERLIRGICLKTAPKPSWMNSTQIQVVDNIEDLD